MCYSCFFFFNDTATTEIYTLSLHDALPIYMYRRYARHQSGVPLVRDRCDGPGLGHPEVRPGDADVRGRSEEHTSELQSRQYLVCRLLLEKKKQNSADDIYNDSITHNRYVTI